MALSEATGASQEGGGALIGKAALIAVGDEVLSGEIVNSNAAWLAQALGAFGVRIAWQGVVGDGLEEIGDGVRCALERADLVVVCGGLGPTHDDRTVAAVASVTGTRLAVDEATRVRLNERLGSRPGRSASLLKQATVVQGAVVLENPAGSAPGQVIGYGPKWIVLLPGPPSEVAAVFRSGLEPWLKPRLTGVGYRRDTLVSYELGEFEVYRRVGALASGQHPKVGIYARPGVVELRFEGPRDIKGASLNTLRAIAWARSQVSGRLYRQASGEVSRSAVVIERLAARGLTVAAMESLSGGMLLASLIAVPGASRAVRGGLTAYTDDIKARYGVDRDVLRVHGAVSAACARAMAGLARKHFDADLGISTTGFAGPEGGTEANPVGTFYVGVDDGETTLVLRRELAVNRAGVVQAVVELTITALWEVLDLGVGE